MTFYKETKMSKTFFYRDEWVDAQEKHRQHPDTFDVPSEEELAKIDVGFTVKVCNGQERFWTEVVELLEDGLMVRVDNNLVHDRGYNFGDILRIEKKHIYEIHTKMDIQELKEKMKAILDERMKNMTDPDDMEEVVSVMLESFYRDGEESDMNRKKDIEEMGEDIEKDNE